MFNIGDRVFLRPKIGKLYMGGKYNTMIGTVVSLIPYQNQEPSVSVLFDNGIYAHLFDSNDIISVKNYGYDSICGYHIGDIVRVLYGSRSYNFTLDGNYGRIVGFSHGGNRIEVAMRDFTNLIGSRGTYYLKPEEIESVPEGEKSNENDTNYVIQNYIDTDIAATKAACKEMLNNMYGTYYLKPDKVKSSFDIDKVIFNNPATIVIWADGTKTVVKANGSDPFVQEYGLAMAIAKKALGNKGNYYETIKKHCTDENAVPKKPEIDKKKPKSVKVTRSSKRVM